MNNTCVLALKLTEEIPAFENADWIGVDKGALTLAQKGIRMRLAVGDFDSVEAEDVAAIQAYADEVIHLNCIKDDSDSEDAVRHAAAMGYEKMIVLGGLGGRLDHEIVNLRLCEEFAGKLVLIGKGNRVECLKEGTHIIEKGSYKYVSFFTEDEAEITLEGMKYPLSRRILKRKDLYGLSNEILEKEGTLIIYHGRILMVQSGDKA